jgi:hypothetical protein
MSVSSTDAFLRLHTVFTLENNHDSIPSDCTEARGRCVLCFSVTASAEAYLLFLRRTTTQPYLLVTRMLYIYAALN